MEEVKTLKAEREVTEKTLRDPVADIVPKFMSALKDFGDVDEESISEAHLRADYSRLQQEVSGVMDFFWKGGGPCLYLCGAFQNCYFMYICRLRTALPVKRI